MQQKGELLLKPSVRHHRQRNFGSESGIFFCSVLQSNMMLHSKCFFPQRVCCQLPQPTMTSNQVLISLPFACCLSVVQTLLRVTLSPRICAHTHFWLTATSLVLIIIHQREVRQLAPPGHVLFVLCTRFVIDYSDQEVQCNSIECTHLWSVRKPTTFLPKPSTVWNASISNLTRHLWVSFGGVALVLYI